MIEHIYKAQITNMFHNIIKRCKGEKEKSYHITLEIVSDGILTVEVLAPEQV